MEKKVTSTAARKPKMELHRITIDKMANGFSVKKHMRPAPGTSHDAMMGMMHDDEPPTVHTKHAPAHKAIQAGLIQMHPTLPPTGPAADGSGGNAAGDAIAGAGAPPAMQEPS